MRLELIRVGLLTITPPKRNKSEWDLDFFRIELNKQII